MEAIEYQTKILPRGYLPLSQEAIEELQLTEGEQVKVIIIKEKKERWEERFEKTLYDLRQGTRSYPTKEVEGDIQEAIESVRKKGDKDGS